MNTTNHTSPSGEELKPCPFCGCTTSPELKGNGIGDNWLECVECGASTRVREDGAGSAKDWNRRATAIGEDAANGAMPASYDAWLRQERSRRADFTPLADSWARSAWKACVALTAEKVAGQEPVGEVTATVLEGADQGVIGWYGDPLPVNSLLYAAPPQPAQSTEPTDDEIEAMCAEHGLGPNVGKLVVKDALNRWRTAQSAEQDEPCTNCGMIVDPKCACERGRKRAVSTATQPVQTQVALTKEMIGAAWRDCGARSVSPPEWALQFAQSIARALLAAQPVSGGEA
jgi:Lar family restriction alleviation protein